MQLKMEPGVSVAEEARALNVSADQVFTWCRAYPSRRDRHW